MVGDQHESVDKGKMTSVPALGRHFVLLVALLSNFHSLVDVVLHFR